MDKTEFLSRFHHVRSVEPERDYPFTDQAKPAAVLIPLVDRGDSLSMLLTERAHHLRHHPGQVSFPGGRVEEADQSPKHTAAREAYEEIGLTADKLQWVGSLPKYRTISRYEVAPIIAFVEPSFELNLDANEVASAFEIPLSEVCNPQRQLTYPVRRKGEDWPIYFIPYDKYMIWGVTAAIIRNLTHHLYDIRN